MNQVVIRRKIEEITFQNIWLLILNILVFCLSCGSTLGSGKLIGLNIMEYVLLVLIEHYYFLYCFLPIIIFVISRYIKSSRDIEKIRYKNETQLIRIEVLSFFIWTILYMMVHVIIAFLIGITSMPLEFGFTISTYDGYSELLLLKNTFAQQFNYPLVAIISVLSYMIVGITVIVSLLKSVDRKWGMKAVIITSILVYISVIFGFKTSLGSVLPMFAFNNYLVLHHALFVDGGTRFIPVIVTSLMIFLVTLKPKMNFSISRYITNLVISRRLIYSLLGIIAFVIGIEIVKEFSAQVFSGQIIFLRVFSGSGTRPGTSSMIGWMRIAILYYAPLFFVGLSNAKLHQYGEFPVIIRHRNLGHLKWEKLKVYSLIYAIYTLLLVTIGFIVSLYNGNMEHMDYLYEIIGMGISKLMILEYFVLFFISMFLNLVLFLMLTEVFKETISYIIMVAISFTGFFVGRINHLGYNLGFMSFSEIYSIGRIYRYGLFAMMAVGISIYYYYTRRNGKDDRAKRRVKKVQG